jgi:hypothetical protein
MSEKLIHKKYSIPIAIICTLIVATLILYFTGNFTQYLYTNKIIFDDTYIMYDQAHSTVIENFRWPRQSKYISDEYYVDPFTINTTLSRLKENKRTKD